MGDGLDVLQLLFLRYLQGCVNSCHHLLTQTGINCSVLNFSCRVSCCCRPVASAYLRLKRNLSNSFSIVDFHPLSVLCGNLRSLQLVYLVVTLSVMMLDGWCFNAKYAKYLHDCYDQFLQSLSLLFNLISSITFNVNIVWFLTTYLLGFSGPNFVTLDFFLPGILPSYSYLPPTITTSRCGC